MCSEHGHRHKPPLVMLSGMRRSDLYLCMLSTELLVNVFLSEENALGGRAGLLTEQNV